MSYIALYRKWRPLVFEDVVEQEHVVKTLKNSVVTGRIAHAYLFCGTRGTGKTTMAKILSRAINCLEPKDGNPCNTCEICKGILSQSILDVVEIDAASNNSVDNVREIRDEVVYTPSRARYKVYIIDEVHMLSTGAFNALLKTLEEPPSHVVFILATTEPHKLPATILSRCQRFDFRRISLESIMDRLDSISRAGGVVVEKEALRLMARLSDGALRDGISILDQCMGMGGKVISYSTVLDVIGMVNDDFIAKVVDALNESDVRGMLALVEKLVMDGRDISQFVSELVYYYRNMMVCKMTNDPAQIIEASQEVLEVIMRQSERLSQDEIMLIIKELSQLEASLKWATHPRILLEVSLMKISSGSYKADSGNLHERLKILENKLDRGVAVFSRSPETKEVNLLPKQKEAEEKKLAPKAVTGERKTAASAAAGKRLDIWDQVLAELKKGGKMTLFTALIGTKAVWLDDKIVGIVFGEGSSFNKMLVSKQENIEVLESMAGKLLGSETRIKCIDSDYLKESPEKVRAEEKDEFMEKANEIAKRLNAPINIIEE
ncbi:MAG: DNA polymerase III subunit gamma/tau [Clostridia bacterium]|nr:DNA polymerase III subunit gamma/tau [Clostridia bacterium]